MRLRRLQNFFGCTRRILFGVSLFVAGAVLGEDTRQRSLDQWRTLTGTNAPPPRVFAKGDQVRFYFQMADGIEAFRARWSRVRVPTTGYRIKSALLRWDEKLTLAPEPDRGWREARVIAGAEWEHLATNLVNAMTPATVGHGVYYHAFLGNALLYRDAAGVARVTPSADQHPEVIVDRRYASEETLDAMACHFEEQFSRTHQGDTLFVIMAPSLRRFSQPLLVDRQQRRCVLLSPSALYDYSERGATLSPKAQGLWAMLPEAHGLALLKNPVSSLFRLVDVGLATVVRFVRLPLPKPKGSVPLLQTGAGMDLQAWEAWLDKYTGTRREEGSLQLMVDGEGFFPPFQRALAQATNHIWINIYVFDRDDIAVEIADQLKRRSSELDVRVLMDRMGSIGAGFSPPTSPLPEHFLAPPSITSYLREDSRVQVRKFLNPWFSSDHTKVLLVDSARAWLGGMNFGREYRFDWHDLMVELQGPVVASLANEFRRAWAHAGPLGDLSYAAASLRGGPRDPGPLPAKCLGRGAAAAHQNAVETLCDGGPGSASPRAQLHLRGKPVPVRQAGDPGPGESPKAGRGRARGSAAGERLQSGRAQPTWWWPIIFWSAGCAYIFIPGMTHVKALLVDDWACLGSGNMNHLSLRVNQEQNVATSDPGFAQRSSVNCLRRTLRGPTSRTS